MRSRYVTFDESRFPGAPNLNQSMDEERISDNNYSEEDIGASSADDVSVDEVDDVMCNPESGTSDHPDVPTDMIVNSAPSNTNDAYASLSETNESNDDVGHLGDGNEQSESHSRYPRRTRPAPQR